MAGELEQRVRAIFDASDAMDIDRISEYLDEDVQGVDELTGGWRRGKAGLRAYLSDLADSVGSVTSTLSDFHTTEWADTGVVTLVLDQTYVLHGEEQHITAPTSLVFRRRDGVWRAVLFHAVPLPEVEPDVLAP